MKGRIIKQIKILCSLVSALRSPPSFVIIHLSLLILFLSCQTVPNIPQAQFEKASNAPLDSGASVYIFADVKEARSIIEILPIDELKDPQVKQMLDRTNYIAAALFSADSGRRFQLTAWGKYPEGANIIFASNKNWKKQKDAEQRNYWHSSADKLSLAMNKRNAFAAGSLNSSPISPFTQETGIEIPEGFNEFRKEKKTFQGEYKFPKAPLSCWLDDPGAAVIRALNEAGIPIRVPVRKLFISLFDGLETKNKYTARIILQFDNTAQARGVLALLGLTGGYLAENIPVFIKSLFFSNPVTLEDKYLEFKSAPLSEYELKIFLSSLYF